MFIAIHPTTYRAGGFLAHGVLNPCLSSLVLPMEQPAPVAFLLERRACVADVSIPFVGDGHRPELSAVIKHVVTAFNARHIER